MFISDLNILETVEVSAVVGGWGTPTPTPTPTPTSTVTGGKLITLSTVVGQTYNTGITTTAQQVISSAINGNTVVSGNGATTNFDNSALGANTIVNSNVSNTVIQGTGSESSGLLTAGASH